jgi:hypothetical protein
MIFKRMKSFISKVGPNGPSEFRLLHISNPGPKYMPIKVWQILGTTKHYSLAIIKLGEIGDERDE